MTDEVAGFKSAAAGASQPRKVTLATLLNEPVRSINS
jgi:hypothetical protein